MDDTIASINATYTKDYCEALSMAYGPNMMSEGGTEEIDLVLSGLDVQNKKVLDFGSGLGGISFHLALNYNAHVSGVEINPDMIAIAQKNTPLPLKDKVSFVISPNGKTLPFADETFDVVFSKGVIVHLTPEQREIALRELYRVLKKGGAFLVQDWLSPVQNKWSPEVEDLIKSESLPLYAHSPHNYQIHLNTYGFKKIEYQDRSQISAQHNRDIAHKLQSEPLKSHFVEKYGEATLRAHIEGYNNIAKSHQKGDLINARITAYKE